MNDVWNDSEWQDQGQILYQAIFHVAGMTKKEKK